MMIQLMKGYIRIVIYFKTLRSGKSWKYRTYIYEQKARSSSQRCMVERLGGISSQLLFQMVALFPRRAFRGVGAEPATNLWLTWEQTSRTGAPPWIRPARLRSYLYLVAIEAKHYPSIALGLSWLNFIVAFLSTSKPVLSNHLLCRDFVWVFVMYRSNANIAFQSYTSTYCMNYTKL